MVDSQAIVLVALGALLVLNGIFGGQKPLSKPVAVEASNEVEASAIDAEPLTPAAPREGTA
jgi:hypothetical protein